MNKYKKGEIVTGYVTGIEKYGIFVSLDEKHDGLIHISEITSSYVRNIHDYVKMGEIIHAKVLENGNFGRVKLSIKDLDYRIGNKQKSKIKETSKGFSTLNSALNVWIDKKITEIYEKNQKK